MRCILSSLLLCASTFSAAAWGQDLTQRLGVQDYHIDTTAVGTVGLDVEAMAFFQDNEFDGNVVTGYSLPGARLQPRLTFTPDLGEATRTGRAAVRLEAGLHASFYAGAGKYPCYAYHDWAKWKGDQYTSGAHWLPFFRGTVSMTNSSGTRGTFVLGNLYGGATHELSLPLYNPEVLLTDDPEMGMQILIDTRRWHSDIWVNWQSFIFKTDTHQEAFTVGWTQRTTLLGVQAGSPHRLYLPIQLVVQHRGGEQLAADPPPGVQTLCNASVGLGYEWRPVRKGILTAVTAEASALAAYQQKGELWPFRTGAAVWASAGVELWHDLKVRGGLLYAPRQFCTLYGSPLFGTVSVKEPGLSWNGVTTGYFAVEYARTFAKAYTFGAKAEGYITRDRTPFSFGAYFRASPSFILKRLGRK